MSDNLPQHTTGHNGEPEWKPEWLPEKWVDRIFDHMAATYGSRFANLWRGTDLAMVKAMWAAKLAPYRQHKGEAIAEALDALDHYPNPPTLPEFKSLCRDAFNRVHERSQPQALPHKLTPEERERQREMAEQVAQVAKKPRDYDGLLWAKRPLSQQAMSMVADAAKEPYRFPALARIFAEHVQEGICTEGGKLLKRWDGVQWVKA